MGWFSDFFSTVLTIVVALTFPQLLVVANLISVIAESLGLTKENEIPEEVGDKMLQAGEQGITPENFSNYNEYNKAIENFKLDPEKSSLYTDREKLEKYNTIRLPQLNDKLGPGVIPFITEIALKLSDEFRTDGRMSKITDMFKNNWDGINKYFKGELTDKQSSIIDKQLMEIEKKLNPGKSDIDTLKELNRERMRVQES